MFFNTQTRPRSGALSVTLCLAASILAWPAAVAHDFSITDVLVVLRSDGTYGIDMTVDVDALALGVAPRTDSASVVAELEAMSAGEFAVCVERARDTLRRRARVRFDGEKQAPWVDFPGLDAPLAGATDPPSVLGITARLTGRIPDGSREFTFGASRAFGPVQLTVLEQASLRTERQFLEPGGDSAPYVVGRTDTKPTRRAAIRRYGIPAAAAIALAALGWMIARASRSP